MTLAVVLAVVAVLLAVPHAGAPRRRLRRLRGEAPETSGAASTSRLTSLVAASVSCGAAVFVLVGGTRGGLAAVAASAVALVWLTRVEPLEQRRRRERVAADLPITVDLLATCLMAGSTVHESLTATAQAIGGPMRSILDAVAAQLLLGADPERAWDLAHEPALAPLGRAVARSLDSGAPLSTTLTRLADELREERRSAGAELARVVGVRATAPLGICFLPAFVLVGIVPVVIGLASSILPAAS